MAMATKSRPASSPSSPKPTSRKPSWPFFTVLLAVLSPVLVATLVFQLDSFEPAHLPIHDLTQPPLKALKKNDHLLQGSELVGFKQLIGPEDIAYDSNSGVIYTSCADGWVKRVTINDSVADTIVESWVSTGGRPLGLAIGHDNEVIVADAFKGLLKISGEGKVELLADEAEGVKLKITDAVDIAKDGTIYFTDASYKYNLLECFWDLLEGKPYGRAISYDPVTKETKVLARDLYFANGIAVSPDQQYVVFCETFMRRCRKYYIQGKKKGSLETFIDNLPGLPDNIHHDGHGHYYIALASEITVALDLALKHPFLRKLMGIYTKYMGGINMSKNSGVFIVDLEGKPTEHYYDPGLALISSGIRIGNHIYCGSLLYPYIVRLDVTKHPARATVVILLLFLLLLWARFVACDIAAQNKKGLTEGDSGRSKRKGGKTKVKSIICVCWVALQVTGRSTTGTSKKRRMRRSRSTSLLVFANNGTWIHTPPVTVVRELHAVHYFSRS